MDMLKEKWKLIRAELDKCEDRTGWAGFLHDALVEIEHLYKENERLHLRVKVLTKVAGQDLPELVEDAAYLCPQCGASFAKDGEGYRSAVGCRCACALVSLQGSEEGT